MNLDDRYLFELTYDVRDDRRTEYETWLSTTTVEWLTSETLCGFHSEQSLAPGCPDVRLLLEFETLGDWLAFVDAGDHQQRFLQLESLTTALHACLWEPAAVSLTPPSDDAVTTRG